MLKLEYLLLSPINYMHRARVKSFVLFLHLREYLGTQNEIHMLIKNKYNFL